MAIAAALAVPLSFLAEHVRNPEEASLMHQSREVGHQLDVLLRLLQERWGQCGPNVQELWNKFSAQGEPNMAEAVSYLGRIAPTDELRELFSRLHAAMKKLQHFSVLFGAYGSVHAAYAKDLGFIPSIEVLALKSSLLSQLNYELCSRTARLATDCGRSQPTPLAQAIQEALNEPGQAVYARLRRQNSDQCQHRSTAGVQFPGVTSNSIPRTSGLTDIHTLADRRGQREPGMQHPGDPSGDRRTSFPVIATGRGVIPGGEGPAGVAREYMLSSAVTGNWLEQRFASDAGEALPSAGGLLAHVRTEVPGQQALLARRGHPHGHPAHNQPRMDGVPAAERGFGVAGLQLENSRVPAGVPGTGAWQLRQAETETETWAAHHSLPSMQLGQGGPSHLGRPLSQQGVPAWGDRPHTQPICPSRRHTLPGESASRGLSVGMPGESASRGLSVGMPGESAPRGLSVGTLGESVPRGLSVAMIEETAPGGLSAGMQSGGPAASGAVRGGFVDQLQHAGALGFDMGRAPQGPVQSGNQSHGRNVPVGSPQTFTTRVSAHTGGQPHPVVQVSPPLSGPSGPPAEECISAGGTSVFRGNHGQAVCLGGLADPTTQMSELGSALHGARRTTSGVTHSPALGTSRQQGFASPLQGGSAFDRMRVDCQRPLNVSNAGSARSGSDVSARGLLEQQGWPQASEGCTLSRAWGSTPSAQQAGGGQGDAGGVAGLPAAFAFRPNISRDDFQLAEQGTPALNLPTGGASALAAESEHICRASWDTEAPSLTPMVDPERPPQAVQGSCAHASGIAALSVEQEGHSQTSGREDQGLQNRPDPSHVIAGGCAHFPGAGHGGGASLSGGGGEAAVSIRAGRGSADLGGVASRQGEEAFNPGEAPITAMVAGIPGGVTAQQGEVPLHTGEAPIPGMVTGIPADLPGATNLYMQGSRKGAEALNLRKAIIPGIATGIPAGLSGLSQGVETGIIQTPVSAGVTGFAQQGTGQALDVVMGIPSGAYGAVTPLTHTGVETGVIQPPIAAGLTGFGQQGAGQALEMVMGIPSGAHGAQPLSGVNRGGGRHVEQLENPEGRQVMDGFEQIGEEMGGPMLTPVDHHSSVMGRADGVRTDARTGATGSSRDIIPNTDDLLDGSEPLSGNAALPPAVAVPSQRDSSSPKNRAGGQQPGPTGNDGDGGQGAILASQPPALGPALEAAAACLSGGHQSVTAGPSPSSRQPLPRACPGRFPQARHVCGAVDALPIICSAPPAFYSERVPSDAPHMEVVASRPGMVMGYPAPMPALGVPEVGPLRCPAPPAGHVGGHADLRLSQRAVPPDGQLVMHADVRLSQGADGASMQPAGGSCQLSPLEARQLAREESQPAAHCLSQSADGATMLAVDGVCQLTQDPEELAREESQPANHCISQRADGASMQGATEAGAVSVAMNRIAAQVAVAGEANQPANAGAPLMPRFLPPLGPLEPYQVPSTGPSSLGTQSEDRNSPSSPVQRSFNALGMQLEDRNSPSSAVQRSSDPPAMPAVAETEGAQNIHTRPARDGGGGGQPADKSAERRDTEMATNQRGLGYEGGRGVEGGATADGHQATAMTGGDGHHLTAVTAEPMNGHSGQVMAPQGGGLGTAGATDYYSARQDLPDDLPLTQGGAEADEAVDQANAARSQPARSHFLRGQNRGVSHAVFPQPSNMCSQIPLPGAGLCRGQKRLHEASGAGVQAPTILIETHVTDARAKGEEAEQPSKRQRVLEGHAGTQEPVGHVSGAMQFERHAPACGGSQFGISQDPPRSEGLRLEMSSEEQDDPVTCLAQREVCYSVQAGRDGTAPFTQVITPAVKCGTVYQGRVPVRQSSPWDTPTLMLGPRQTQGGGEGALLCYSAPADVTVGLPRTAAGQSPAPGASHRDLQTGTSGPNASCAHLGSAPVPPGCEASEYLSAENPQEKENPTGRLLSVKSPWTGQAGVDRGGGRGLPTSNPISLSGV